MRQLLKYKWVFLALALAALVVWQYEAQYAGPRRELTAALASVRGEINGLEGALDEQFAVRRALKDAAATTLGKRQDVVEHRLRTLLTEIAERSGLTRVVVSQRPPMRERSPLETAKVQTPLKRALQKQTDFAVIEARLVGEGTLEQAVRTLAAVRTQPWAHRVLSFSLQPREKAGDKIELRLDMATVYAPDLLSEDGPEAVTAALSARDEALVLAIAGQSPFRAPEAAAPPVVAVKKPEPPPTAPPPPLPPAYDEWKVTGVVRGSRGVEVLVINMRSGERRVLNPGARVLDATLVDGAGERAVFEIGGARWTVMMGESLAARRPAG